MLAFAVTCRTDRPTRLWKPGGIAMLRVPDSLCNASSVFRQARGVMVGGMRRVGPCAPDMLWAYLVCGHFMLVWRCSGWRLQLAQAGQQSRSPASRAVVRRSRFSAQRRDPTRASLADHSRRLLVHCARQHDTPRAMGLKPWNASRALVVCFGMAWGGVALGIVSWGSAAYGCVSVVCVRASPCACLRRS